jgi:hypothetical protein
VVFYLLASRDRTLLVSDIPIKKRPFKGQINFSSL